MPHSKVRDNEVVKIVTSGIICDNFRTIPAKSAERTIQGIENSPHDWSIRTNAFMLDEKDSIRARTLTSASSRIKSWHANHLTDRDES